MTLPLVKRLINDIITCALVASITNHYQKILSKEDAINLGLTGKANNGAGNRDKIQELFDVTAFYGNSRESKRYPENKEPDEAVIKQIEEFKKHLPKKTGAIVGYKIHGLRSTSHSYDHPIRKDIRTHFKGKPCVFCGQKGDCVDHKNDLYNDTRVLSEDTQTESDFQSTCNACNTIKRGHSYKTKLSGKRFPATNIPSLAVFEIDFLIGDESYDKDDPNALVGTYWYDPVAFMEGVNQRLRNP
tara:strand:- start:178 stop:909 length:732 start_codon:yes stop_codon:yes gene_type:complete